MVKSLDDLIRHLVDEVALRGEEGEIVFDLSSRLASLHNKERCRAFPSIS